MTRYAESGPTRFIELVEPLPRPVQEIAARLWRLIRKTLPDADENVSGGARMALALYSIGGENNVVCGIQPAQDMCRLFFHGWPALQEAGYRLDGSGKNARHVKIRSIDELDEDRIADMIQLARKARGFGEAPAGPN